VQQGRSACYGQGRVCSFLLFRIDDRFINYEISSYCRVCEVKPCSFNGVYQPSLLETFPHGKVLLLSYFYDRIRPLLTKEEAAEPVKISTIASLAQDVCLGMDVWSKRWGHNAEVMSEMEGRPEWCLDLTFMHSLLRLGYEFADNRQVEIGKQVEGTELGWCLGASIAMIGAELKCRV
jgi:guanosine-diphosphatase